MFRSIFSILISCIAIASYSQIVTLLPGGVGPEEEATLIFDASEGNQELMGADKVYIHHGVVIDAPDGTEWKYVIGNWGQDDGVGEMTRVDGETDKWMITMSPTIREYFQVHPGENIFRISCVFRSADGSTKGTTSPGNYGWGDVASNLDFYINMNTENYILIKEPNDIATAIQPGETIKIIGEASSSVTSMKLWLDEGEGFNEVASVSSGTSIEYDYTPSATTVVNIKLTATLNGEELEENLEYNIVVLRAPETAELPGGLLPGINYHEDPTRVTLVLEAPGKEYIHILGDFTDYKVLDEYQMKRTPDGEMFWLELNNLEAGKEYIYLYGVADDLMLIPDPYAEKIADPWNDPYIEEEVFPDVPDYDRTDLGIASTFQTGQQPYEWSSTEDTWQRPDVDHLMIYELHIRDFLASHSFADLIDTLPYLKELGINAIELMPINEFEGNDSWGYNPSFFFAPDKYYGTKDQLKEFIEKAHEQGMAVILDIVLNHAFGQNPMLRLYLDTDQFLPAADNPWFNREYVGQYQWGFDFNHESPYTQRFVDRVNRYWLEEYHFDGYRFDFTKGFTNYAPGGSVDGYDESRIAILKRMADEIWEYDPEAYVILEHWSPFQEEEELGAYGMKMWANRSYDFVPAANGAITGSFNNMERGTHVSLISSHDERRVGEHILTEGRSNANINLKDTIVMYERVKMTAAFAYLYPGPKMMWQFDELGYDIDINFNGRTGRKPYVWGAKGNGYYDDPLRQYIYDTYKGILNVRNTITPQALAAASTDHKESGATRRLSYDTEDIDLVVIGNFGLSDETIDPAFTQDGKWYNYFSGDSITVTDVNAEMTLASGEWHIFTTERLSEGSPEAVKVYSNPVTITPYPFKKGDEIKITFDASAAFPGETSGLVGAEKVYFHSGVVKDDPLGTDIDNIVGNLMDDGIGEMTNIGGDLWEITLTPSEYYSLGAEEEIYKLGMYFRDANNENVGLGFRDQIIFFNVASGNNFVTIDPPIFDANTEITITFDATQGNRELVGAEKVYVHSSATIEDTDNPENVSWRYTVGNWGMDDGIGQMTKKEGTTDEWQITLTPKTYYNLPEDAFPYWISAVFRSADGNTKGTGDPGEIENGFIASNQDFFIRNGATSSLNNLDEIEGARVFPNPTTGIVDFSMYDDGMALTIFTIDGREVLRTILGGSKIYDLSNLNQGIYTYFVRGKKKYQSGNIVVK